MPHNDNYVPHNDNFIFVTFCGNGYGITVKRGRGVGPTLVVAPMGVKFGVSPLQGEKPQNRPLSKLNTGALRCAQCCR